MSCDCSVMCLFIIQKKRKEKRKRKQNPYKVRKIKEKTNKNCLCPKHPITDRGRKEVEVWKVGDRVMLSMKNLVFKKRLVEKLVD